MISIIMPVYNAEAFLRETVQSVLNQTYSDFELIAINDGSTDSSLKILNEFGDERIRIIDKANSGVSDTRNTGLRAAKGEYVCFLDADDLYSPNYLMRMYETTQKHNADMVVCNFTPFRGKPVFLNQKTNEFSVLRTNKLVQAGVLTSACTKLIKISTLYKHGIFFNKDMTFGEDLFFCWEAFLASDNVWMIDEPIYGYRMGGGGATRKYHPNLYEKYKSAFIELKEFGKQIGKDDDYMMDFFFTTRIPSFISMTVREKSTFSEKKKRLTYILNDNVIQEMFADWDKFIKFLNPEQTEFYKLCKDGEVKQLLYKGYKRQFVSVIKDAIRG